MLRIVNTQTSEILKVWKQDEQLVWKQACSGEGSFNPLDEVYNAAHKATTQELCPKRLYVLSSRTRSQCPKVGACHRVRSTF